VTYVWRTRRCVQSANVSRGRIAVVLLIRQDIDQARMCGLACPPAVRFRTLRVAETARSRWWHLLDAR